jgi:RNA polymerase sigma-70 factor (ECF subfamily)
VHPPEGGRNDADVETLVREARTGDRAAQAILFRRFRRQAAAAAYRVLGLDDELDDVVQESFARAFGGLATLREPERFGTWLTTIAVGTAVNVVRKRRLRRAVAHVWAQGSGLDRSPMQTPRQDTAVELRVIEHLVMSLEAEARQMLILRHWDGLTLRQIAEHTGCSLATVKRRSARADAAFAERLRPPGDPDHAS